MLSRPVTCLVDAWLKPAGSNRVLCAPALESSMFGKSHGKFKSKGSKSSPGRKGKGKAASQQETWWGGSQEQWPQWTEAAAAESTAAEGDTGRTHRRLLARDNLVKKILRPYAAADGRVLYGENGDEELLSKASLRTILTPEISELSRRPAWGISMAGKSVAGLGQALVGEEKHAARNKLTELLRREKGREFLEALEDLDFERHKFAPEDLESKFKTVFAYCKEEKTKLHELLPQVAAAAAREYVGAVHALDLVVKANAMAAWAEQVPDEEHLQPYLDAFRGGKVSAQKAAEFLVGAYKARKKFEASWKRSSGAVWGDDSDDAPEKPKRHKRKPETSDDSSEQKKKKSKKERKDKKRKASSSSGSSSSEDVKTKKKEKGGKKDDRKKKRKASSSEEEAKPAAKAKNRELEQKAVPQVTLSLGDASEEEPEGESPYADWPQPNRVVFAAAVQEAQLAQKATSKSEKLTLSGLVSVMDNIPETALKHHQLEEVLTTLKKMERLPKKEKVELILESLQALADAANAKPVLAEMPPGLKTPTEEAPEETEAPEDKDASKEKEDEAKEAEEADDKET